MRREDKQNIFYIVPAIGFAIFLLLWQVWKYFAAREVARITKTPIVVFPGNKFRVDESPEGVRFLCENNKRRTNNPTITKKLETLLKVAGYSFVYKDARVIMIKMNGFIYGTQCHEFMPEGGAAPGSYYTYQMYGDNRIQVTNYVEDGISYLAGFCIYVQDEFYALSISYPEKVVREIMESSKLKYNPRFEPRTEPPNFSARSWNVTSNGKEQILLENFPNPNWTGKYCETLQREVMTETSNGAVYHKEWNIMLSVMTIDKCVECSKNDQPPAYTSLSME